ncbi:MAG TPA: universal stress protein [Streptosporangiaceae bacterium]
MSGARRVIVGASGSPGSLRALRYAEEAARRLDALLIPVMVWTPPGGELAERRTPSHGLRKIWEEAASELLAHTLEVAWGELPAGLTTRPTVVRGEPGHALVELADSTDDLLVVGAGRRSGMGWLWGARVSRYCLRHARCPVLAVPPATLDGGQGHGLRGWAFRHRELTLDRALRDWGRAPA